MTARGRRLSSLAALVAFISSAVVLAHGDPFTHAQAYNPNPYCSEDVLSKLSERNLARFVLMNCVSFNDWVGTPVLTGGDRPGPNQCLSYFIGNNTDIANLFPFDNSPCQQSIMSLVEGMTTTANNVTAVGVSASYDATSDELLLDATEMSIEIGFALGHFQDFNKRSIMYPNQCSKTILHAHAMDGTMNRLIAAAANSDDYATVERLDGICDICYHQFYDLVKIGLQDDPALDAVCLSNPMSDECQGSRLLQDATNWFANCAGQRLDDSEAVCTAQDKITIAEKFIPTPYVVFIKCRFEASFIQDTYCRAVVPYIATLTALTSQSCSKCYQNLFDNLITADAPEGVCADAYSESCVAFQDEVLFAFEVCAGFSVIPQP